jgi:hypothetical protein
MKPSDDRRGAAAATARRMPGSEVAPGREVKLSPGGTAELIDISATGALVETSTMFTLGAAVRVLVGGARPQRLAGRVVRSQVCAIHRDSTMSYHVAIAFDDPTQLNGAPDGSAAASATAAAPTEGNPAAWAGDGTGDDPRISLVNEW